VGEKLRVLIADDNQAILDLLRQMLGKEFEVVGALSEGGQVLEQIGTIYPDVLILDISIGDLNGFEIARELNDRHCRSKIIFLTAHHEPAFVSEALQTGVSGYVYKSRLNRDLREAISAVCLGQDLFRQTKERSHQALKLNKCYAELRGHRWFRITSCCKSFCSNLNSAWPHSVQT
jgi:DNA-binding NarL/FixJ family response regulator